MTAAAELTDPGEAMGAALVPRMGMELASRVGGRGLAEQVEEYFEHGARVEPGDVVIDVGANVGAFAAAVAERTGGQVTIHCFEPATPLFAKLRRNFAQTAELSATRHELHPTALTRADLHGTERPFYYFSRFPTDSTYELEHKMGEFVRFFGQVGADIERSLARFGAPGRVIGGSIRRVITRFCRPDNRWWIWSAHRFTGLRALSCRLVSLEQVLAARGIARVDLLKVDVEGAELDVLHGCGAAWPAIQRVAIETDDHDGRADAVIALLEDVGLRITSCAAPGVASHGDARQRLILAERP